MDETQAWNYEGGSGLSAAGQEGDREAVEKMRAEQRVLAAIHLLNEARKIRVDAALMGLVRERLRQHREDASAMLDELS